MKDNDPLAITITFKDIRHGAGPKTQFKESYYWLASTLEASTDYEMYPEWRMVSGTIHYHGVIIIKDKIKWLRQTLPRLKRNGFIKIKPVREFMGWIEYCSKEAKEAKEILNVTLPMKNGCIKHIKPEVMIDETDNMPYTVNNCKCIECQLKPKKK